VLGTDDVRERGEQRIRSRHVTYGDTMREPVQQ
jgi:hypothetical protein